MADSKLSRPAPALPGILEGPPDPTVRALAAALAAVAIGRIDIAERVYEAAAASKVELAGLREGALMAPLFAGFPRAIEAFTALERHYIDWPEEAGDGHADLSDSNRTAAGANLFDTIYGRQADPVRKRLVRFHPVFERSILQDAYGRILARPALAPSTRELMSVCALAASDLPIQLKSHLRGALRCGASVDVVAAMAELAASIVGQPPSEAVIAQFDAVLDGA